VLERAAVVGQAFEQDTVAAPSTPDARAEVSERLGRLVRREFLRTAPARLPAEAGYQFRHLLVRDAVYQSVPKQVRADLHERLAGLLEARAAGRLAAAGRRALARGDTPAATVLLDRAVALLPDGHPQLALLRTDLADSLITAGDYRRGDQTLTEALAGPGRTTPGCAPTC
jgi:predicted ATPase